MRASEQDREDVQNERHRFREELRNEPSSRFVFVDESGAKTNMTRGYGWAEKGQRAYASAPYGHWETTTMIGSVRLDGQTTCMTLDGAVDRDAFIAFLKHVLGPSLQEGDVVIMDNLPSHKSTIVSEVVESFGARVRYLPSYSPDYNPIEMMWSKIKQFLKSAKARTEEGLIQAIGKAFQDVKPSHALGWFNHCGYVTTQS